MNVIFMPLSNFYDNFLEVGKLLIVLVMFAFNILSKNCPK